MVGMVEQGFECSPTNQLLTLFSTPNDGGKGNNGNYTNNHSFVDNLIYVDNIFQELYCRLAMT